MEHSTGNGIAELVFGAIQKAPIDTRQALYEHIVLSGGSTMFPGLPTRIEKDLNELYRCGLTSLVTAAVAYTTCCCLLLLCNHLLLLGH